jgi:hypothetical protein
MKKTALVLATVGALAASAVAAPTPAEARFFRGGFGFGPAVAGGLLAGAVIGGVASSAYAWGPGYGYGYGYPGYYGGYAPAYYGAGYGWDPYPWGGVTTTYYTTSVGPAFYGPRFGPVVRPAWGWGW